MVHVRKMVATVHDLANVLGRVASGSLGRPVDNRVDPEPIACGVEPIALDAEQTGLG